MKRLFRCTLQGYQEGPGIVLLKVSTSRRNVAQAAKRHWGRYNNGRWPSVSVDEIKEIDGYEVILKNKRR